MHTTMRCRKCIGHIDDETSWSRGRERGRIRGCVLTSKVVIGLEVAANGGGKAQWGGLGGYR